jgi:hypothetical protein
MLNFNLTKDDIGYLRLLIDIQSCEDEKKSAVRSVYSDSDNISKYSIYGASIKSSSENV